ncbi:AI-2E family transporter [Salibacter sp.]|uniref:AI-2E family transporter n=1 Tax=Salibacter sp. TaxID=2010995 RepID=UPI002870102C|nr:AI-2E family transporter [Salibacter sp.]MDR9397890.1 AI-2E family transporter [Salibacter sp.]MDR9486588.1 AI-2E family transporter [Salibacter sp.]
MTNQFRERVKTYSHISIVLTFIVVFVIASKAFLIPLLFSLLLSIVLNPLLRKFEKLKIGRIFAIILVLLTATIVIGGIITYTIYQMNLLIEDLPSIQKKITSLFDSTVQQIESLIGVGYLQDLSIWENALGKAAPLFSNVISKVSSITSIGVQIPIYVFLIMLYKERFSEFLSHLWKNSNTARERTNEVKGVIQNYVTGLSIVILILAVLNSVGLFILGIKYALFFGIFSAVLTVIPYFGNLIGGFFPFLIALVTKDSAWYAVGVIAVYAFVQFLEGNFITPNIMGSKISVNPLAALVSLIVGGQILGITGIILAIPVLGILKVTLQYSETLKPIVALIEDK